MKREHLISAAALVAIAASLFSIVGHWRASSHSPERAFTEYLGARLGEEAGKLMTEPGRVLFMIPESTSEESPAIRYYIRGFREAVDQVFPGTEIVIGKVGYDSMAAQEGGITISADDFTSLLRAHADCQLVLSLAGIPGLSPSLVDAWSESKPRLIIFATVAPPLGPLFDAGILHCAVALRPPGIQPPPGARSTFEGRFEYEYEILYP